MHKQLKNFHFYLMLAGDAVLCGVSLALAYLFRFEFSLTALEQAQLQAVLLWAVPLKLVVFFVLGLYRGMWRYTSTRDFWRLLRATVAATLLIMALILFVHRFEGYSRALFLVDGGLTFLLTGGLRMVIRTFYARFDRRGWGLQGPTVTRKRILIIGAGAAGEKILREILESHHLPYEVVGFIDDDPVKRGRSIHGVPVLGALPEMAAVVRNLEIKEVLIAVPSATGAQVRGIVETCKACGIAYKTLPGIGELIDGRVSVKALRDVNYEDLLGRSPVQLDTAGIEGYLEGKTVLVTGCGGSIGSELCRQVVRFRPGRLILLDASEANLFHIDLELRNELRFEACLPVLGSILDRGLLASLFERQRPQVVFHAAAYKHVPMLELNPWEAVSNNIQGSRNVMALARQYGVERFVLVSTDKAVRPTNVMGASKRVTELLLRAFQAGSATRFMAVRFGNVVGSSGSVIPVFRKQIEQGMAVTVTHPEVTRYFMTIPEAAQLILQAGAMGEGGEIFILEMGTPVKILEMARDLIRLSGKEPDRDVPIVFTGLRPGEKLYEELITTGEGIVATGHEKILVLRANGPGPAAMGPDGLEARLAELGDAAGRFDAEAIRETLHGIVPEYTPQPPGSGAA